MKRIISVVILVAVLCFAAGTFAAAEGGEDFRLHSYVQGTLVYDAVFLDPHTGPGYRYIATDCSAKEGETVRILTKAWDAFGNTWVLCEVGGKRVYLLLSDGKTTFIRADLSSVPAEPAEQQSSWQCMPYETPEMRFGPGWEFPGTGWEMRRDDASWVVLMNGDWALVEQTNAYDEYGEQNPYFIRGWVPFDELIY